MSEVHVLRDVLIIFSISVLVVFVFQKLRLPAVAGFLVAGTLVGPHGLNLISDQHQVETLAEIGVVLLLFTIGLETSLSRLRASSRLLWVGGPLQIMSMLSVVVLGGWLLHRSWEESVFWGLLLSLSSTAIVLKILGDRGEIDALHGQATMAILIFQDLAVVAMILMTPVFGTGSQGETRVIVETLMKSVLVVGLIVLAARVLVPHALHLIVGTRSRELFLLAVIVLGLGTAWLTSLAGLSLALGAFVAGLVISESEYSHQALADVIPFRDSFNSLFFVSVGMLMNPSVIFEFPILVVGLLILVVLGKFVTGTGAVLLAGAPVSSALLTGVALAQVGEFAFILARVGQQEGLLDSEAYNIFLAVSVLSMTITPFLIQWAPRLARRTEALDRLKHWLPRPTSHVAQGTITVTSIVGRFLEHSRCLYFRNGGKDELFLGSADLMSRNMDRRVEILFPIENPKLRAFIVETVLRPYLKDNMQARQLQAEGTYTRLKPSADEESFRAQDWFVANWKGKNTKAPPL
jgi:CPA2 family monovalent cation:H+ antiporter-2